LRRRRLVERVQTIHKASGLTGAKARAKTFAAFEVIHVSAKESNRAAYRAAKQFAEDPQGWVVLLGSYGCGKTHLLLAIGNELLAREEPVPVVYANAPDLLDWLKTAPFRGNGAQETYDERFQTLRTVDVLLLDDLGAESPTPWAMEKLFQLLDYRYLNELATVIASNLALEEFPRRLASRLCDRSVVRVVAITSGDYRERKKARR